jgi:hypothetical protein
MPNWVKAAVDRWMLAAKVSAGRVFRSVTERLGAKGSPRTSYGTLFGDARNGYRWTIWLRMTFAEPVQNYVK